MIALLIIESLVKFVNQVPHKDLLDEILNNVINYDKIDSGRHQYWGRIIP